MSKAEATPTIKNSERKDRSIRLWGGGLAVPSIPVSRRPGRRDRRVRAEKPNQLLALANENAGISGWQSADSWRSNKGMYVS